MPKPTLRLLIPLYTYFGILSLKLHESSFTLSPFFTCFNVARVPISFVFYYFLLTNQRLRNHILRQDIIGSIYFSTFEKSIILISAQLIQFVTLLICTLQFFKRREIRNFMDQICKVKLSPKLSRKLLTLWKRHFVLFFCLGVFVSTVQLSTNLKSNLLSVLSFVFLCCPYFLIASFMSFTKSFEYIFISFMQDFRIELIGILKNSRCNFADRVNAFSDLSKKYQNIFELILKFNRIFGLQLTAMTSCVAAMTIFQVRP